MRPPRPRLALRSLVRGGPAGPGSGLGWPRQEWTGVAKPLIQLHLVAFRCIPYRLRWAHPCPRPVTLILTFSPQGRRDRSLRGNDAEIRGNDVWEQCSNRRGYGAMGCCRRVGVHPSEGVNFTLILTFSPQGRRDLTAPLLHTGGRMRGSRLRGNDGGYTGSDGVRLC